MAYSAIQRQSLSKIITLKLDSLFMGSWCDSNSKSINVSQNSPHKESRLDLKLITLIDLCCGQKKIIFNLDKIPLTFFTLTMSKN